MNVQTNVGAEGQRKHSPVPQVSLIWPLVFRKQVGRIHPEHWAIGAVALVTIVNAVWSLASRL